MTRLLHYLFNIWAVTKLKTWPKAYKNFLSKLKVFPNAKRTLSKWPKFITLCHSGEISSNLVSLLESNIFA